MPVPCSAREPGIQNPQPEFMDSGLADFARAPE